MTNRMRLFAFTLGIALGFSSVLSVRADDNSLLTLRHTNATALVAGPNYTNIVKVVAAILQTQHYLRLQLNDDLSSRFFDRHLDPLDNPHIYSTKGHLEQFEKYRTPLDELSLK